MELYRQGCGYILKGCWKVKYKTLYSLNFFLSLTPHFLTINRRPALDFLYFYYIFIMPLRSPTNCFFKSIPQYILALPLYIKPQPLLTCNQCQAYLNAFAYTSSKDQKSDKKILEVYNKTYCVRFNTFSPCDQYVCSKSNSCIKVSFFILR